MVCLVLPCADAVSVIKLLLTCGPQTHKLVSVTCESHMLTRSKSLAKTDQGGKVNVIVEGGWIEGGWMSSFVIEEGKSDFDKNY